MIARFTPSKDEQDLVSQILTYVNCLGTVSADAAAEVFKQSGLPINILSDIWNIADEDGSGSLSEHEIAMAVRLMGWAQAGVINIEQTLLQHAGPLPVLEGISGAAVKDAASSSSGSGSHGQQLPPIINQDAFRFVFLKSGPVDGLLDGDIVRDIFLKSDLPYQVLAEVWNLVDAQERGALDVAEFILGMHLIQALKFSQISSVPTRIAPELYGQLRDQPRSNLQSPSTSSPSAISSPPVLSTAPPPVPSKSASSPSAIVSPPVPPPAPPPVPSKASPSTPSPSHLSATSSYHFNVSSSNHLPTPSSSQLSIPSPNYLSTPSPSHRSPPSPPSPRYRSPPSPSHLSTRSQDYLPTSHRNSDFLHPQPASAVLAPQQNHGLSTSWDVTPNEQKHSNQYFDSLDPRGRGFVDGDVAAKFMLKFKLPSVDVAHIWDLADINSDDRLTRESFAVAIHLVNRRLAGDEIPFSLPQSLVPPSMRPPLTAPLPAEGSFNLNGSLKSDRPRRGSSPMRSSAENLSSNFQRRMTESTGNSRPAHRYTIHMGKVFDIPDEFDSGKPIISPLETNTSSTKQESSSVEDVAFRKLDKEAKDLRLQVEELTKQLASQTNYQERNVTLVQENGLLKAKMRDMELSMSQVLLASNKNNITEELSQELARLSSRVTELEPLQAELEESSRRLAESTGQSELLTLRIRDANKAKMDAVEESGRILQVLQALKRENEDLKTRASAMERSMAEPTSAGASRRELRVLLADVTKENETLKEREREMQQSMTQLLLSGKDHNLRELERENRRLTLHSQEMEALANQLQSSNADNELQWVMENLTRENEELKSRMREIHQQGSQERSQREERYTQLQRQVDELTRENNRLKVQASTASTSTNNSHDDPTIPPPAYEIVASP